MEKLYRQHVLKEQQPEGGFVPLGAVGGIKPAPAPAKKEMREESGSFGD